MVFTHGFYDDHSTFDVLTPSFVAAGYRVVTWNLPGHGVNPSGAGDFTLAGAARDVVRLVDESGARQAVLVGHSLGAYISQEAAIQSPHRVLALVVIGGTSLVHRPAAVPMAALRASVPLVRLMPSWLLRRRAATHGTRTAGAAAHTREVARHVTKEALAGMWSAFADAIRHIDPRRRLHVPTLVCRGEHDRNGIIPTAAPRWARRHANIRYRVIPGAGHLAHRDNPAGTAEALLSFLSTVSGRDQGL
ncbi:alpha/beta hydrolase [Lentzea cavernae]|uniref:Alpha/beta hydrolase n=1 Tax=Lentzea cavernae TaxID=2020703 RepID=A0ABQ3MDQ0_9PSEU|nr:alpha/beta hydrolase [Lentzea cavernae]